MKQSSKFLGGQVASIQRKRNAAVAGEPVKKLAVAYLPADASSCGRRGYLAVDDAQAVGAVLCRACGLYHEVAA